MSFQVHPTIAEMNPRIVPIRNGKKGPTIPKWTEVEHRVSDLCDENRVFDCDDHDAYGIVIDSDLIIVDIDIHEGQESGFESLQDIKQDCGLDLWAEAKLIVRTPSGGAHLYFRKSEKDKLKKTCRRYPAIDLLQEGCQVLGPGSRNNGYWVECDGKPSDIDARLIDAWSPQAAPKLIEDYDPIQYEDSPVDSFNQSESGFSALVNELRAQNYTVRLKSATTADFIRPNKTSGYSISGTIGNRSKQGNLLLRNFSTSDPTFPSDESVTIAHAFACLRGLDNSRLPSVLRSEGFGSQIDSAAIREFARTFSSKNRERSLSGKELEESYPTLSLEQVLDVNAGERRPYIINGLLRSGEVMNIIAAPKTGKSFMIYNLAISLASGLEWMGYTSDRPLNVLIVDNELHVEELGARVKKVHDALRGSQTPSNALGGETGAGLHFTCLRGTGVDIDGLKAKLDEVGGSRFDIIVIDALYRILPAGASENDNAAMTSLYNKLDSIASGNDAAIVCVHHTSKGSQSDKAVTDVGSGAGAISRAADTHLVIRQHAEEGFCVIDAVTRSGKSPGSVTGKFDFPLWTKSDRDPELKSANPKFGKANESRKSVGAENRAMVLGAITNDSKPRSRAYWSEHLKACGRATVQRHIKALIEDGAVEEYENEDGFKVVRAASPSS